MLPVEVGGVPWVLFRTNDPSPPSSSAASTSCELDPVPRGNDEARGSSSSSPIACLRDECAHRACPLSLGRVDAAGRAVCPYHGWAYDGISGSCVEMPSTLHRRGVGVAAMRVAERDGVVWGWMKEEGMKDPASSLPSSPRRLPPLPATAATPKGFVVVAEATVAASPAPPEQIRDALARGGASLAARAPGSAAARGLFSPSPPPGPSSAPVETTVVDLEGGASAVLTSASGLGGSGSGSGSSGSDSAESPPPSSSSLRPLRLLHLVAPGRDGGSRLLLRVCVAEGAVSAVFGAGKRRLWASLAAEAAEEDAEKPGRGGGGEESDGDSGGVGAGAAASSVFRL